MNNSALKLFNSLGIPKDVFNPAAEIIPRVGDWNLILSPRARGKTTNIILYGMCEYWTRGTQIQYIRQYDDMLTPSQVSDLFEVILKYGYIQKLTGGKYNSVKYWRRRWYLVNLDPDGNEVEKDPRAFMVCLAINREHDYRSTYNAPEGDFIIVDEFMRADKMYLRDEFLLLCNLLSTIIRDRTTAKIFLLANLVDITCPYLAEMGISDIVKQMTFGDFKQIKADNTVISILLISPERTKNKSKSKYFGLWQNQRLTGITGAKGVWAIKIYPHAPKAPYKLIERSNLRCSDGWVCMELRAYGDGLYLMFYPIDIPLEDKITYTTDDSLPFSTMRRYGLGYTYTDDIRKTLVQRKRCYYSDNTTGERVTSYFKSIR